MSPIEAIRAKHLVEAAREAVSRVPSLGPGLFERGWFPSIAETLIWLAAVDDLLQSVVGRRFIDIRDAAPNGRIFRGLRYVRNLAVHGDDVIAVTNEVRGAELGILKLGVSKLGVPSSWTWLPRSAMPAPGRPPAAGVEDLYDDCVAGRDVLSTLLNAVDFAEAQVNAHTSHP